DDVSEASEPASGDDPRRDGAGDKADHDPGQPRARLKVEAGGRGDHLRNQFAITSNTSSLPRSLKGSWYRPSSMRSSLAGAFWCSSLLLSGSISRSAVPARIRNGSLMSPAWSRLSLP